jgi:hypothetical protein
VPPILERGVTGLLRSRWGVAFIIALLILAVVGVGRLFSGGDDQSSLNSVTPDATVSVNPSIDDDSVIQKDDPPVPAKTSPGAAKPEAVAYAFASAWVDHKNVSAKVWHDGILPNATQDLAEELNGVDPADVPADSLTGKPTMAPVGDGLLSATITVDSGTLTLQLVAPDGRWLVDGVDWARS